MRPLLLALVLLLAGPALAGPPDRYTYGQQLGAVLVQPGAANTVTITVPANRVLTIVAMQGGNLVQGTIAIGEAPSIPAYLFANPNSDGYYPSFVLLGPATLTLSGEDLGDPLLLTYALTRVRTVSP